MAGLDRGAEEFAALGRRLRDAGEGGLRRDLYAGLKDAVRPALAEVRRGLPDHMPARYAEVLGASLKFATSRRETADSTGVRVIATARGNRGHPRKLPRLEAGILGHPVFGMRKGRRWKVWVDQTSHVQEGFFAAPLLHAAPQMRDAILAAMHTTAAKITRKA